jgi:hypothetical protein
LKAIAILSGFDGLDRFRLSSVGSATNPEIAASDLRINDLRDFSELTDKMLVGLTFGSEGKPS